MGHIPTHPPAPAELWGVDELAAYLGVTEHFVYRLTKQHRIRFVRVGRTARFRPADVAAWLQAEAVPPPGPSRSRPSPAGADPRPGTAGSEHGAQADLAERYRYLLPGRRPGMTPPAGVIPRPTTPAPRRVVRQGRLDGRGVKVVVPHVVVDVEDDDGNLVRRSLDRRRWSFVTSKTRLVEVEVDGRIEHDNDTLIAGHDRWVAEWIKAVQHGGARDWPPRKPLSVGQARRRAS